MIEQIPIPIVLTGIVVLGVLAQWVAWRIKVPAIGFDATTTIKRSEFGLGAYAPAVSDEVSIRITTEASVAK